MLKSGLKLFRMFFYRKPRRLTRTNSHWTELYPSPEPSFLKKQVEKTCDWVYGNIDRFFQDSAKKSETEFKDNFAGSDGFCSGSCQVWMLNQGVIDIACKDIKESFSWLLPGFIMQFAYHLQQQLLLYFFTDNIVEEESSGWDLSSVPNTDQDFGIKGKTIFAIQEYKEETKSKFLSISDWWVRLLNKLSLFTRMKPQMKTYYLLGDLSYQAQSYVFQADNQNLMIRGPDKSKLNLSFSFHIRN